jgi:hypothetical protein
VKRRRRADIKNPAGDGGASCSRETLLDASTSRQLTVAHAFAGNNSPVPAIEEMPAPSTNSRSNAK